MHKSGFFCYSSMCYESKSTLGLSGIFILCLRGGQLNGVGSTSGGVLIAEDNFTEIKAGCNLTVRLHLHILRRQENVSMFPLGQNTTCPKAHMWL